MFDEQFLGRHEVLLYFSVPPNRWKKFSKAFGWIKTLVKAIFAGAILWKDSHSLSRAIPQQIEADWKAQIFVFSKKHVPKFIKFFAAVVPLFLFLPGDSIWSEIKGPIPI